MSLIFRYLLGRLVWPLLLTLALLCGLLFGMQAMRLGHHLLGQGMGGGALLMLLLLSLPTLLVFVAPFALPCALLLTLGALEQRGELDAMRLAGASGTRLAAPAGVLILALAGLTGVTAWTVEPAAVAGLRALAMRDAVRVMLLQAPAGQFRQVGEDTTLHVARRLSAPSGQGAFSGFFMSRDSGREILLARRALVRVAGQGGVSLELHDGEIHQRVVGEGGPGSGLRKIRFGRLTMGLELGAALDRHLGFLATLSADPARAIHAASLCAGLGCLALLIALGRGGRLRKAALGLAGVLAYQALLWGLAMVWTGVAVSALLAAAMVIGAGVRIKNY